MDVFWSASGRITLTCPFCLRSIRIPRDNAACPECREELPQIYKLDPQEIPPFFVPLIGWTAVGKTVFLQAFTLVMEHLGKVWPDFVAHPANAVTMDFQRKIRSAYAQGTLPEPTPMGFQETYLLLMKNMERWGGRTLVLRDCAGEHFEGFEFRDFSDEQRYFLKRSRTTLMMVSLPDLQHGDGKTMDELFLAYVNTLLDLGTDVRRDRRKVIVVLSKADQIPNLPPHLEHYMRNDPFQAAFGTGNGLPSLRDTEMALYVEQMERASEAIRGWLSHEHPSGERLMRQADDMKIQLRFAITSALGSGANQNNDLVQSLMPRRVLDPFFWILEFHSA